jgi:N-glycosylase/DNA lyase
MCFLSTTEVGPRSKDESPIKPSGSTRLLGAFRVASKRSQTVSFCINGNWHSFAIPGPDEQVIDGVRWGSVGELFTPAYWSIQAFLAEFHGSCSDLKLGHSFIEEVVACLLGGHGIKAETGMAAFENLKQLGMLSGAKIPKEDLTNALKAPLLVKGRLVRYRFATQKAKFIHDALRLIASEDPPQKPLELRSWLLKIRGIGLKTASWITRNWMKTDSVAIIDIHIWQAGKLVGLFHEHRPDRDYLEMEDLFIKFAQGIRMKTSTLDTVIWSQMRSWGHLAGNKKLSL